MIRLPLAVAAMLALPGAALPARETVTAEVDGLRSSRGVVRACLTADPDTFPDCQKDPEALHATVPASNGGTVVFRQVLPGRYAIALFHDENANGRLDKVMMIPREGFGFSRDAPVRFGPPRFAAAAFVLGDAQLRTIIRVRYLL